MKNKLIIILILVLAFSLYACDSSYVAALQQPVTTYTANTTSSSEAVSTSPSIGYINLTNRDTVDKTLTGTLDGTQVSTAITTTSTPANVSSSLHPKVSNPKIIRELIIHYIDVGQADCIFVELPTGENMLIDTGNNLDSKLIDNYLKNHSIVEIDYLFGTHPDEDHIGSLDDIIMNYDIGALYMPDVENNTKTYKDVLQAADTKGLLIIEPKADEYIINDIDNQLYLKVLAPAKDSYVAINNYSTVLKLVYDGVSFLFTGDAEDILEYEMIDSGVDIDVDVVKIAHHGSDSSTSGAFLTAASPVYAVVSVGLNNSYGHPSQSVIDKLYNENITVYRTDLHGTVIAVSDGKTIVFETEKQPSEAAYTQQSSTQKNNSSDNSTDNSSDSSTDSLTGSRRYIGNINTKKLHDPTCGSLPKENNRKYFYNFDNAIDAGYEPCKICKPAASPANE
ncbi:MAG: MBL fold metallo-hydrolase [Oscillospiraceae bacterium]|nr:MBL fold metallo-hydrolase [Oscillospiraceae bacterium]